MKIQQSTAKPFIAPKPQVATPAQSNVGTDTVSLGQAKELQTDIGRMYSLYRNSNSQQDQTNIKREMIARLDSSSRFDPSQQKLSSLLNRVFAKNDRAWKLKAQASVRPDSEVDFNMRKHQMAGGQPLCGRNLFNVNDWQERKNLIPMTDYKKKCGNVHNKIEDDLDKLGGGYNQRAGCSVEERAKRDLELLSIGGLGQLAGSAAEEKIKRDLQLIGGIAPNKTKRPDSSTHRYNQLA